MQYRTLLRATYTKPNSVPSSGIPKLAQQLPSSEYLGYEPRGKARERWLPTHHLQASAELTVGTSQSQSTLPAYILTMLCHLDSLHR